MVPLGLVLLAPSLLDLIDDVLEHVAEEDRDDRRRGLVGAQAVVVGGVRDRDAEQVAVAGDGAEHGGQEDEELRVVVRGVAGLEQVVAQVVRHRPVDVLARAVDARERLLVQQQLQAVAVGHPLHRLHDQHVVVGGDVGVLEHRRELVLRRGDLVVPGLDRDAELVQLDLGLEHARQDALGDGAEVVVLHLLPLGGLGAEEGPAGVDQVGPGVVEVLVDQEVFLLRAAGRIDLRRVASRRA